MFKRFFEYALMGAGACLGYFAASTVIDTVSDPVKKAEAKKKINKVKSAIKGES